MPKIRDHKRPGQKALLVSPWQSKHDKPTANQPAARYIDESPCLYSVMTSDTLLVSPGPRQQQLQTATAPATHQDPPANPAAAVALSPLTNLSNSSGWHTRPKHPTTAARHPPPAAAAAAAVAPAAAAPALQLTALQEQTNHKPTLMPSPQQQQQHAVGASVGAPCSSSVSDMSADPTEATGDSQQEAQSQHTASSDDWLADTAAAAVAGPSSSSAPTVLQGVAQLVLHPSGAISGHFVALNTDTITNNNTNRSSSRSSSRKRKAASEQGECGNSRRGGGSAGGGGSSSSSRLCLGLQGRQVLGVHSCYRDPEWALLQLSIIRYSSGDERAAAAAAAAEGAAQVDAPHAPTTPAAEAAEAAAAAAAAAPEVEEAGSDAAVAAAAAAGFESSGGSSQAESIAWVQRKGGDLVTLEPADMDDEDTEAAVLADNMGELPDSPIVNFTAHTLLSGAAAAGVLRATRPELVGQPDLVVNLGDMTVSGLPLGFLRGS